SKRYKNPPTINTPFAAYKSWSQSKRNKNPKKRDIEYCQLYRIIRHASAPPQLGLIFQDCGGSMSGTVIHPLAVFCVSKLAQSTKSPIMGVGGVSSGADAAKILLLRASCVGICIAVVLHGLKV
ncbi:hypothetical protein KA005_35935, partial [bacterium]|nr:hypothetical protein [bacterium]